MREIGWRRWTMVAVAGLALWYPRVAASQVFAPGARTEFQGGFAFRTFVRFTVLDRLIRDGTVVPDSTGRRVTVRVIPITVVYGAQRRFSVIGVLPMVGKRFQRIVQSVQLDDERFGVGDAQVFTRYRFFKRDRGPGTLQLAVQAGVKFPTGRDAARDRNGVLLPAPLQLGSGSTDVTAELIWGWIPPTETFPWIFSADLGVGLKGGVGAVDRGNQYRYDVAAKYRVWPRRFVGAQAVYLQMEINGSVAARDSEGGVEIDNSGGHEVFVSPSVFAFVQANLMVEAGIQLPVMQKLNGTQLAKRFTLLFGLRYVFLPR